MKHQEQDTKANSFKLYITLTLFSVAIVPLFFFLVFSQVIPFTSRLPYYLGMLVIALFCSIFGAVVGYLMFAVAIPVGGLKVGDRMKSIRMWSFGWIFITTVVCSFVFLSFVYDNLFPMLDGDIRSVLSPLTVLLIFLILTSPPLRSKTTRFFERVFGTESRETSEQKIVDAGS